MRRLVIALLSATLFMLLPAAAASAAPVHVLVVGDSLAAGMRHILPDVMPSSRVTFHARSGQGTPWGMMHLRWALQYDDARPDVIFVSLGTNDGPNPRVFRSRIRRFMRDAGPACVIWSTIVRPPRKGPYYQLNDELFAADRRYRRLHLIRWDRAIVAGRATLPDTVHPDQAGYLLRARMYAHAARTNCR